MPTRSSASTNDYACAPLPRADRIESRRRESSACGWVSSERPPPRIVAFPLSAAARDDPTRPDPTRPTDAERRRRRRRRRAALRARVARLPRLDVGRRGQLVTWRVWHACMHTDRAFSRPRRPLRSPSHTPLSVSQEVTPRRRRTMARRARSGCASTAARASTCAPRGRAASSRSCATRSRCSSPGPSGGARRATRARARNGGTAPAAGGGVSRDPGGRFVARPSARPSSPGGRRWEMETTTSRRAAASFGLLGDGGVVPPVPRALLRSAAGGRVCWSRAPPPL